MFKQRCKISVLTAAAMVSLGLPASPALALVLGSMNVQSRLGEPLRAEVPIPQLSTDEAETLSVDVAPPAVFLAQGLEYSAIASHVRITIQRREDGSAVLNVRSTQPVNEPFFDLILDASWAGGNLRRNYTMLLSPPVLRPAPVPEEIIPAQVQPPADASTAPLAGTAGGGTLDFTQGGSPQAQGGVQAPAVRGGPAPAGQADSTGAGSVQVRRGDTAGRIAAANLPAGVSLEQMLVALLQANPDAFIRGNVNLVRAGAVLTLPDAQTAQNTPQPEARRLLAAQTRDFNQYRRQLASAAPPAPATPVASGSAGGSIPTLVPGVTTPPAPPDQLILGAGEGSGGASGAGVADKTAAQLQREAEEARLRELQENLDQIGKIAAITPDTSSTTTAPADIDARPDSAAAGTGVAPDSGPVAVITNPAAGENGDAQEAANPAPPAQEPDPAADTPDGRQDDSPAQTTPPQQQPLPEPSLLDTLLEDPMIPLAAGGLLVLLLGYGGWRVVQRRRATSEESTFDDSSLDDESLLYDDGGQQINTDANTEQDGNTSSLFYSPSQLDAGDVDPVAEADVYLAYGRDQQAEEILREALRADHARPGLHLKLAEIYAKRSDKKAFENTAKTLRDLTQGKGTDWEALLALGRTLDPDNALYQASGGKAAAPATAAPAAAAAQPPSAALDGVTEFFASSHPPATPAAGNNAESTQFAPPAAAPALPASAAASAAEGASSLFKGGLPSSLSLDDFLGASATDPAATAPVATQKSPAAADDGLHLDLNLDGDSPAAPAAEPAAATPDPLLTKVELAKEFNAIGDSDGARALLEEVLSEAPEGNPAKAQAQRLLAEMK